ncbi:MAG: NAD(P)H-dependent glycerol-3-phosphate dehydrogenase [Oscillospiraceae bacterium]|nr:NAD(P)H-dependent glycerol-3-phosphate dehydrogenase [Oscillospiraceae bacterium]
MKITVAGCGRWGTFIAWYLDRTGHDVTLYGRSSSENMKRLISTRKNDYLELTATVKLSMEISSLSDAEAIVISVGAQGLRDLCTKIAEEGIENKIFILCMKGLEIGTGCRLSEIAAETLHPSNRIAVWLGPGHVQEFYNGIPNCMVIDSEDEETKHYLVKELSGELIRFYFGTDIIGNEIGAAAKNVIGIAAGMLDGAGVSSLKGALMARGAREIARLIKAMGGSELSAYGLCHLGDYEATVFSKHSHNRLFGEAFIKGEDFKSLAEGYYTVRALVEMGEKYGVDLPICNAVYTILYEDASPKETLDTLFRRNTKSEF